MPCSLVLLFCSFTVGSDFVFFSIHRHVVTILIGLNDWFLEQNTKEWFPYWQKCSVIALVVVGDIFILINLSIENEIYDFCW